MSNRRRIRIQTHMLVMDHQDLGTGEDEVVGTLSYDVSTLDDSPGSAWQPRGPGAASLMLPRGDDYLEHLQVLPGPVADVRIPQNDFRDHVVAVALAVIGPEGKGMKIAGGASVRMRDCRFRGLERWSFEIEEPAGAVGGW